MKEAFQHIDNDIVFREIFRDEQTTRRNHGIPTDVTYNYGYGEFNGSSSEIDYAKILEGKCRTNIGFSWEIILTLEDIATEQQIMALTNKAGDRFVLGVQSGILRFSELGADEVSGAITLGYHHIVGTNSNGTLALYINTIAQVGNIANAAHFINEKFIIGAATDGSRNYDGIIDLIQVWNRTLSAAEVANL